MKQDREKTSCNIYGKVIGSKPAKITASVMQIYTVFKGILNGKGNTLKQQNNLAIKIYWRKSTEQNHSNC